MKNNDELIKQTAQRLSEFLCKVKKDVNLFYDGVKFRGRPTKKIDTIMVRLKNGWTEEEIKAIIVAKAHCYWFKKYGWQHLNFNTLLRHCHMDAYLDEARKIEADSGMNIEEWHEKVINVKNNWPEFREKMKQYNINVPKTEDKFYINHPLLSDIPMNYRLYLASCGDNYKIASWESIKKNWAKFCDQSSCIDSKKWRNKE